MVMQRDIDLGVDSSRMDIGTYPDLLFRERNSSLEGVNAYSVVDGGTKAYFGVPVILRNNTAGAKYNVGDTVIGRLYPEKISVINSDGSDYASYDFLITSIGGNDVYVNTADLEKQPDGSYKVIKDGAYPYKTEIWINTKNVISDLPSKQMFLGYEDSIKTLGADDAMSSATPQSYVVGNLSGKTAYVPLNSLEVPAPITTAQPVKGSISLNTESAQAPSTIAPPVNTNTDSSPNSNTNISSDSQYSQDNTTSNTDSGKILGIPKVGFWIGVGVVTFLGGYILYRKFRNKN